MPPDAHRVQAIFLAAIELINHADRNELLQRECGNDAELRQQVETLLRAYDAEPSPAPPEPAGDLPSTAAPSGMLAGQLFAGRYKLRESLGVGGMGEVWVADQTEPVQRRVALKVIKAGMDSRRLLARFEQERQALALMDHPNIAKVFDAGVDEHGHPYFVMELVKGLPLTKYCDDAKLSPRQRLELFIPVCQAVQHAHQKGIIHRDLKPSNILVGLYDGRPVPKVIDFGVAKATGPRLTEESIYTEVGSLIGTLEYMSPEQAELNNLDIDSRTDIYAMGVILYELLTGAVPFSRKDLKKAGLAEMLRVIKEEEPPKPSTRLSGSGTLPSIAAQRHTEPKKLTALVRGELDWIVMKALEKDRGRRYETANGFAMDVQRYLADDVVEARPPGSGYRLRKFLRRHRGPVIAAGLVLLALLIGMIGTTAGMIWAVRERDAKANALVAEKQAREKTMAALRDLTDDIVENQMARETTLTEENKEFLRKIIKHFEGLAAITGDDAESQSIRAEGYFRVGLMRYRLGELKEAEVAYTEALAIRKQLATDFPTSPKFRQNLAKSHNSLGVLFGDTSRPQEEEAAYADALIVQKQLAAEFPSPPDFRNDLALTYYNLGNLLSKSGRLKDAKDAHSAALVIRKQLAADFPTTSGFRQHLAMSHNNIGHLLREMGRRTEAEAEYRAALDLQKRLVANFPTRPEFRRELARSHSGLASRRHDSGRPQEAEAAYTEALAIRKQLAADFPTRPEFRDELAQSLINLGIVLTTTGQRPKAEAALANALAILKPLAADFPTRIEYRKNLARCHNNMGILLAKSGRLQEAEAAYTEALAIDKQLAADLPNRPDDQNSLAGAFVNLANLSIQRRDFAAAMALLENANQHHQAALKANPRQPTYRQFYLNNLVALVAAHAGLRDQGGAVGASALLRDLGWDPPGNAYVAARALSRCIPIVHKDDQLDATKRQSAVQFYGDEALKMLKDAVAKGFKDVDRVKKDKDLDPLRDREEFQKLLAELEGKGN